ncbi:MAG: SAP domain-containing protein [Candidatus Hodarchaeota archaeon]
MKDFLRSFDLKVSGNKDKLIKRLISNKEFNIEEILVSYIKKNYKRFVIF